MNNYENSKIFNEVKYFKGIVHKDSRGRFEKPFYGETLESEFPHIREVLISTSFKNVIRGLHFQTPPYDVKKIIYCTAGRIKDVFIDIRKNSPTYGEIDFTYLSEKDSHSILIPEGFAHGFSVLSESATVVYLQSKDFKTEFDKGIHPLSLDIDWEVNKPVISDKDLSLPKFEEFDSPW